MSLLFPTKTYSQQRLNRVIQEKTILITGASRGIGREIAISLACEGVVLIVCARNLDKLQELALHLEARGAQVHCVCGDLYTDQGVEELMHYLRENDLQIDIFVNNAGKSIKRSIFDSTDRFHDFSRTMSLNYYAPVHIILKILPDLTACKGKIINVSALDIWFPAVPKWAAYQASKLAFDRFLQSASLEFRRKGIRTSTAYLPLVKTEMIRNTSAYKRTPAMEPQQAAAVICQLIISGKRVWKPWWVGVARFFSYLFFGVWNALTTRFFHE